jgi:Na(+)-translocating NADH:ubiquinone oxidoreductase F subunit
MILLRKLHKWFGLAIGLQVAIWMLSGLMMGLLEHERVQGHNNQAHHIAATLDSSESAFADVAAIVSTLPTDAAVTGVRLQNLVDRAVYRVSLSGDTRLFNALTGTAIDVDASIARAVASRDYAGAGEISAITEVQAPSMEIRRHNGKVWRVDFDDTDETSIYVSGQDGAVLERRNATWRLFDIFWMLHIMDYQNREDFNNALIILFSLGAAWLSISGVLLLFNSFNRSEFLGLLPGQLGRRIASVTVHAPHGEVIARLHATEGSSLYDELAKEDIVLPSNCGGGGTCGLCVVQLGPEWPETAADQAQLPEHKRESGARLSCQARVRDGMDVSIPGDTLAAETLNCTVASTQLLTPHIREIVLKTDREDFSYRAGSFVHVIMPPHQIHFEETPTASNIRQIWPGYNSGTTSRSEQEIRRAYSLALPCEESAGRMVLNVRFMPPPDDSVEDAGVGSGFMWNLNDGDSLQVVGPLGDFHATDNDADMIVIGGGAGMAPLRAIIREQLRQNGSSRRIDFWYGARGEEDLLYVDEFDNLQNEHERFCWHVVLSDTQVDSSWSGLTGFVHESVRENVLSDNDRYLKCEYYICGPPPMLAATRRMLAEYGVPATKVFFDDFGI